MPNSFFARNLPDRPSPAQCGQIKQAVAQYGYASARRHVLETYVQLFDRVVGECEQLAGTSRPRSFAALRLNPQHKTLPQLPAASTMACRR